MNNSSAKLIFGLGNDVLIETIFGSLVQSSKDQHLLWEKSRSFRIAESRNKLSLSNVGFERSFSKRIENIEWQCRLKGYDQHKILLQNSVDIWGNNFIPDLIEAIEEYKNIHSFYYISIGEAWLEQMVLAGRLSKAEFDQFNSQIELGTRLKKKCPDAVVQVRQGQVQSAIQNISCRSEIDLGSLFGFNLFSNQAFCESAMVK